eukprot:6283986-Lingulodinium_polyedra.AAC.1
MELLGRTDKLLPHVRVELQNALLARASEIVKTATVCATVLDLARGTNRKSETRRSSQKHCCFLGHPSRHN